MLQKLRQPVALVMLMLFVDALGFAITIPVLPLFATGELGASVAEATLPQSIYWLAAFLAGPLLGRLGDRYGRKPVLVFSQFGTLLNYAITALAPSMAFIYLARVVDGITAGNFSVAQAYVGDVSEPRNRAKQLGSVAMSWSVALAVGPALGGWLAPLIGPRNVYLLGVGLIICTMLITWFLLPESNPPEKRAAQAAARAGAKGSMWDLLRRPVIATLLVVILLAQFAFFSFQAINVLWTRDTLLAGYSAADVSRLASLPLTLFGVFGVLVQLFLIGPMVRRFGERNMMMSGLASRAVFFAILALAPSIAIYFGATPFLAYGTGMMMPNLAALQTYAAPPERRGQALGLNQSAGALGSIFGPIAAGLAFERVSPGAPMLIAFVASALALLVSLLLLRYRIEKPVMQRADNR